MHIVLAALDCRCLLPCIETQNCSRRRDGHCASHFACSPSLNFTHVLLSMCLPGPHCPATTALQDLSLCWQVTPTASLEVTPTAWADMGTPHAVDPSQGPPSPKLAGPAFSQAASDTPSFLYLGQPTPFLVGPPKPAAPTASATSSMAPTPTSRVTHGMGRAGGAFGAGGAGAAERYNGPHSATKSTTSGVSSIAASPPVITPAPALLTYQAGAAWQAARPQPRYAPVDWAAGEVSQDSTNHNPVTDPSEVLSAWQPVASPALSASSMPSPHKCVSPDGLARASAAGGGLAPDFIGTTAFPVTEYGRESMMDPAYASFTSEIGAVRISTFEPVVPLRGKGPNF